jgi:glycerol transport system ATP-binding protein
MTLVLEKVSKVVAGSAHIRDVSISLQPGTINVLLGPTLAGKTSLMRLLAGLDVPTSGRILIDGKDVTGVAVRNRSVAMVYQQFINYPAMTVFENIASPLRVRGAPKAEIVTRVRDAAKLMRLEPYLERTPLSLSGGQQQRTAIARALVKGADLVLLDEPLANLDYKLREELRAELPRIFAGSNSIFVYATTEPSEALLLGGNTATLHQGGITQFGPTIDVYRAPHDRQTAEVFSDPPMNFLPVTVANGAVTTTTGQSIAATGSLQGLPPGQCGADRRHWCNCRHARYGCGLRDHRLGKLRPYRYAGRALDRLDTGRTRLPTGPAYRDVS